MKEIKKNAKTDISYDQRHNPAIKQSRKYGISNPISTWRLQVISSATDHENKQKVEHKSQASRLSKTHPLSNHHHLPQLHRHAPLPHDGFKSLLSLLRRSSSFVLPQLHPRILESRLAHAYLASDDLPPAGLPLERDHQRVLRRFWEAVDVCDRMLVRGVRPNEFTFTFVLPACAGARSASEGRSAHGNVLSFGCGSNVFVATALVDMYGKCGDVRVARKVFDGMPVRGTASFNALIVGYVLNGESIFNHMQESAVQFDAMTMVGVLQACSYLGALQRGR
ncbi:pentatricopeptide repeat-containing protein At4g18520, chloroplastic-like [Musa acuminata AAA Group]|uniref:pentatricopeptide repeat-containing protein At4g18520, chloroplastic-like n=1 Tax=Musa acuminata AAA Group TaxID=214697 RepID=UPI0031CDC44C